MTSAFPFQHAPFDTLSSQEQQTVASSLDILYFPAQHRILQPGDAVDQLYVVMKGRVEETGGPNGTVHYSEQEVFDSRALVNGTAGMLLHAAEDTIVWQIPRDVILDLTRSNPRFAAFFYDDVARKLAELAHQPYRQEAEDLMLTRISDIAYRPPSRLDCNATVMSAARAMQAGHVTSVLVEGEKGCGIFTQSDLRNFIIAGLDPNTEPVEWHASYRLHTIEESDYLHQAMLLMVRHTIQRLIVTRRGEICGILEQVDLLSSLANNPHSVGGQIERAGSISDLHSAAAAMQPLTARLFASGMKVTLIAELMSELRQKLLERLFTLLAPAELLPHVCLLVLGSEGRGEQILRTDQDNALIIEDGYQHPQLGEICQRFTAELLRMGYPPCPGGIMLSTREWCGSVSEFRSRIKQWTGAPDARQLMALAIWTDARPICGNPALHAGLDDYLRRWLDGNPAFLAHFAWPVEQFEPPLTLFSRLVTEAGDNRQQLDLKKGGIFPIVHGIRSLALEHGVRACNTYERLQQLHDIPTLPRELARDLAEALAFLQGLQLKTGLVQLRAGQQPDNLIDPRDLTTLERDLLKDSLGVVKRFRQLLRHHYRLGAL
ncbi:putative nucleotidyltransferase substrate binding domain-containing protein [Chitinilyticum piscinae]|uniref:Cyclic nucleotide-binding/CBS domain-containing protein n=1 Tax=Chitinilyticum piscinae TaxID=2866724 RepID=A0A8J7FII9_9NEIS|nr:putative nucleotidyltransferase substrate binding domain-containing protein [Chitinilyticum piscinae]MBE9609940.1 cyclic nucleotide-binding/CBS domain-containing protein [Chitinilyticum piscinae]